MRRASNRNVMAWTFMGNTRMHQVLREKGNKLSHVGVFTFEVSADGTISETGTAVSTILPYVKKWPHIKWLLTIMNHGTASIFTALRENTNGAQDTFLSEIVRIIDKYPWCSGIDIDLERGGELANRTKANALFSRIYSTVKAKGANLHVNICLPGMTSVGGSVGGENWCVYADLDAYCDTAAIMSYGMSWAGSAPGPVSPRSWLEGIYSYAANAMNPDKIMMGLPGYGWRWQIYDTTENLGTTYRGTSLTYYAAKYWMEGLYNHTGDAPPQPFIPFFSYWDWTDMVPWGLLQVYDFMEGWDTSREIAEPTKQETYSGRKYLTTYLKQQEVSFGTISVDRDGVPDSYSGNAVIGEGYALSAYCTAKGWRVLTATTTHIRKPVNVPWIVVNEEENTAWENARKERDRLWQQGTYVVAGTPAPHEKLTILPESIRSEWISDADITFLEADGAKCLPCKFPAAYEPVILPQSDIVLAVAGLSALYRPLGEVCFRAELAIEAWNRDVCEYGDAAYPKEGKRLLKEVPISKDTPLTPELLAWLLGSENGARKDISGRSFFVVLNQADTSERREDGRKVLDILKHSYGIQGILTSFSETERNQG